MQGDSLEIVAALNRAVELMTSTSKGPMNQGTMQGDQHVWESDDDWQAAGI